MLKKRETIAIQMEILASLFGSPKGPTRLAQACNVNYGRIAGFTDRLVKRGLVRAELQDGQETYFLTDDGYNVYKDWLEIWRRLKVEE